MPRNARRSRSLAALGARGRTAGGPHRDRIAGVGARPAAAHVPHGAASRPDDDRGAAHPGWTSGNLEAPPFQDWAPAAASGVVLAGGYGGRPGMARPRGASAHHELSELALHPAGQLPRRRVAVLASGDGPRSGQSLRPTVSAARDVPLRRVVGLPRLLRARRLPLSPAGDGALRPLAPAGPAVRGRADVVLGDDRLPGSGGSRHFAAAVAPTRPRDRSSDSNTCQVGTTNCE